MKKTTLLSLPIVWIFLLTFPLAGDEPRPSLKQLIAESRKDRTNQVIGFTGLFSAKDVRKNFFGDEAAFRREVAALLQTGENRDIWDVYFIIVDLDIYDETIFNSLKEIFASLDHSLQIRLCSILASYPDKECLDFLIEVLKQPDYSANLRWHAAYCLSYFTTEKRYFEDLDAELKNGILQTFLSCLDEEEEVHWRFRSFPSKLGDAIAPLLGYYGSFSKPALPKIREKYIAQQDEMDVDDQKIRLAWAILRIAPDAPESSGVLEYILRKSADDENDDVRWEAIDLLGTLPSIFFDKTIPCLLAVIQKETSISNKIAAAKAIQTILEHKEYMNMLSDK